MTEPGPHQSLYRRFRPQRFAEVRGQDHVSGALRNAVRDSRPTHAYLFSGPRGTGKTSTARILGKALNCTALEDGEPCGTCESCLAVQQGSSLDVHELDAASNNGVEAMRELVSRAALATPGRWKVYIVDEVHMLSQAASNTLLKTLEEPPAHVVFVLATTDPQKVLATVKSRTQHYEFRLLGPDSLGSLLAEVNSAAGLGLNPETLDVVARRGRGSARDALSALDQVAAAGKAEEPDGSPDELVEALCERDAGRALRAVGAGCAAGHDARRLATEVLELLRDAFLAHNAPDLMAAPDQARPRLADQGARLGPAGLLRAMEALGQALIDMRDALEPRITLEVAVVRVAQPDLDVSRAAVLERLERVERRVAALGEARDRPLPSVAEPAPPLPRPTGPAAGSRAALGSMRPRVVPGASAPTAPSASVSPAPLPVEPMPPRQTGETDAAAVLPTRDQLTKAWGDRILSSLPGRAKARFGSGRFRSVEGGEAVFALPNEHFLPRCQEVKGDVEAALAAHFGGPVPLRLVVDDQAPPAGEEDRGDPADLGPLGEAPPAVASPEDRLRQAFPGAEEVPL